MTTNETILAGIVILGVLFYAYSIMKPMSTKEEAQRFKNFILNSKTLDFENKELYIDRVNKFKEFYTSFEYKTMIDIISSIVKNKG